MPDSTVLSTKALYNRSVAERGKKDKIRRIGKVRRFVFHPKEKRLIGVVVKRPDVALMFHRSDLFVAIDSLTWEDDQLIVSDGPASSGSAAIERLGVDWNKCVMWVGMQLVCEDGTSLGHVGSVEFDAGTGKVRNLIIDEGATAHALLGVTTVPASLILGFRWGVGDKLRDLDDDIDQEEAQAESEEWQRGAILLSDEALELQPEGGLAEAAAKGSVVAVQKTKEAASTIKETASVVKEKATQAAEEFRPKAEAKVEEFRPKAEAVAEEYRPKVEQATSAAKQKEEEVSSAVKPVVSSVAKKTGEVVNKGAFALGKQIGKSSGMFSGFMDEYRKALRDEDDDKQ